METENSVPQLKNSSIKIGVVVTVIIISLLISYKIFGQNKSPKLNTLSETPTSTSTPSPKMFSMTEIEKHTTPADCWFAVEGKVYDVTKYIASGMHKGGDAILQGCGKDATTLFNTRPMGSGTAHSDKARGYMENFQIGTLE